MNAYLNKEGDWIILDPTHIRKASISEICEIESRRKPEYKIIHMTNRELLNHYLNIFSYKKDSTELDKQITITELLRRMS